MDRIIKAAKIGRHKPLREVVYQRIKSLIIKGKVRPGERIMENKIAEEIKVSKTPIREAMRKLEKEGLIVMLPRKGAYVTEYTEKDAIEVIDIRISLEGLAAFYAAKRVKKEDLKELYETILQMEEYCYQDKLAKAFDKDQKFHEILYILSDNKRLIKILTDIREEIDRLKINSLELNPDRVNKIPKEHRAIYEAIKENNPPKALILAEDHIISIKNTFLEAKGMK